MNVRSEVIMHDSFCLEQRQISGKVREKPNYFPVVKQNKVYLGFTNVATTKEKKHYNNDHENVKLVQR